MKKLLITIILLMFATNIFAYTSVEELATGEGNLEDIAKWIKTNIKYKQDTYDYWQKSEETLQLNTGDCEDIAVLFYDTIKQYGYEAKIYIIGYKTQGHALCIFKNRNNYWQIFDTAGLHEQWGSDLNQLIKYTYLGCNYFEEINPKWKN